MEGTSAPLGSSLEIPPRTLGEKVFDFLPETVPGKLAASYDRERLARRIIRKLGKEQRSDKSIHDGVISFVLDENIPSSIKKSILKHLVGNVPLESSLPIVEPKPVSPTGIDAVNEPIALKSSENDSATKYFGEVNQKMAEKLEKEKKEKEEEDEKKAKKELSELLASVFPEDCKDKEGQIINKKSLIERFLNTRSNVYKFLLQRNRQKRSLGNEVKIFFDDLYFSGELSGGKNEEDRIRKHLSNRQIDRWENLRDKIKQAPNIEKILKITQEPDFPVIEWDFVDRDPKYIQTLLEEIERNPSPENIEKLPRTFDLRKKVSDLYAFSLAEEQKRHLETKGVSASQEENIQVDAPREGYFGSSDYKEAIDDQAEVQSENKRGIDADGIVEGFGVVGEAAPEIVFKEEMERKTNDAVLEKIGNGKEEDVLEGESLLDGEESLQELRDRARLLKGSSDEARNRFLTLRHRNTSKWLAVKKALFSSRPKEPPESLVDEVEVLKSDWKYKLTLYKDAVIELAKREAAERKLDGKAQGALMAEAIRGLDVQGLIENYDAWKNASWGDRKDSGFLRMLGRARDWAEQYRKLDWKKRVAISAVVVGTGVAGVAVGSAGLVGLGVAGSTIVRLLGAYGAGRGSYEFLESRANQKTLQYNEAALSNVEKIEDIDFLERRMKTYADRVQKDLDRAIAGNRKRVAASVALGSVLLLGGTAFAHRDTIQEFLEQMKIITGLENFHGVPVLVNTPGLTEPILNETTPQPNIPTFSPTESIPLQSKPVDVPLPPSPSLDANSSLAPTYQNVESVTNMFPDMMKGGDVVVARGNSIQGTLIEHFRKLGFSDADAGKFASRVSDAFGKDHPNVNLGKVFENTKIHLEPSPGSSGPLSAPFKIEGIEFAPSGPHGTSTIVGTMASEKPAVSTPLQPKPFDITPSAPTESIPLQPKPFDIPAAPSSVETPPPASFPKMPEVNLESPQNIFDRVPPKTSVPSLEDTLKGNIPPDVPASIPNLESIPAAVSDIKLGATPEGVLAKALPPEPLIIRESQDVTSHFPGQIEIPLSGVSYAENLQKIVTNTLENSGLSQERIGLVEAIFRSRIDVVGIAPTSEQTLSLQKKLAEAFFPGRALQGFSEQPCQVGMARADGLMYGAFRKIGGEGLNVNKIIEKGDTVNEWLRKMAIHILTHPIEFKK